MLFVPFVDSEAFSCEHAQIQSSNDK